MYKELKTTFKININNLTETQHRLLQKAVLKELFLLVSEIEAAEYGKVLERFRLSPAGDCMGSDHYFIETTNIGVWKDNNDGAGYSLHDAIVLLKNLKRQSSCQ